MTIQTISDRSSDLPPEALQVAGLTTAASNDLSNPATYLFGDTLEAAPRKSGLDEEDEVENDDDPEDEDDADDDLEDDDLEDDDEDEEDLDEEDDDLEDDEEDDDEDEDEEEEDEE